MRAYLRRCRAYLYTGTQPAPYTLGLMEAMMTGVPVVSIGPKAYGGDSYLVETFEGHVLSWADWPFDDPIIARSRLKQLLREPDNTFSEAMRVGAIHNFGIDAITEAWRAYLG
jgi:glycosyltransferase involved in cell wall biosynthesis